MRKWVKNSLIGIIIVAAVLFGFYRFWMYPNYTVPILMYHHINDGDGLLHVSAENFERQMKYLRDHQYNVISLDEFVEGNNKGEEFSHNTVVITFDDGSEDNYTNAFPILKKYKIPAVMFIITQSVGTGSSLTWDQVNEMAQHDIDFGSHTQHHVYFPDADTKTILAETVESKKDIELHTGKVVNHFAYPIGGFTNEAKRIVKEAGYLSASTTNRGFDRHNKDVYELMRIKMTNFDATKPFHFWGKLSGYYNLFRSEKSGY